MVKPIEVDAPADEVLWQGLRWVEAVYMQVARFEEAAREEHAARKDAQLRALLNDPERKEAPAWRADHDARPIGERASRVPSYSLAMQTTTESDFLMVAIRNLLRAQDRLPDATATAMKGQEVLKLLRDQDEHYDKRGGWAQTALATKHPRVMTDAYHFTNKEIWLGGGPDGVPLSRVREWAARVDEALRVALAAEGVGVPDRLNASTVEDDDELPWPEVRLRYGWWLPIVDESEWPTEE